MGLSYTVLGILFLALVILNCSVAADLEVQRDSKSGKNVKDSDLSNKNDGGKEKVVNPEKKGKDQIGSGLNEGAHDKANKDTSSISVGLKGADGDPKKTGDTGPELKKTDNEGSGKKKPDDTGSENGKLNDPDAEKKKTDSKGSELKKMDNTGSEHRKPNDMGAQQKNAENKGSEQKKKDDTGSEHEEHDDMGTKREVDTKEKAKGDSGSQSKDIPMAQVRKGGGEVCDSSSNRCTIEEKSVIACLRVAGSESEELSLLIQNKGKGPVSVAISAPDFVKLEKKQIQVPDNKNEKVKVSIGNGESKSGIILKAGNGNCTIDFKEMSSQSSKKDSVRAQLAYINILKSTPSVWFIFVAAVLVIASVCIGNSFRRKYVARNSPSYEKLEMELPVSSVGKVAPHSNDGWDDNWGDSWDDEEAPTTPSMPVTPSLSSHGIASRRINKEAWKD